MRDEVMSRLWDTNANARKGRQKRKSNDEEYEISFITGRHRILRVH